jgi:hypothetical protein
MRKINSICTFHLLTLVGILSCCTVTNDVIDPGDKPIIQAYQAPGHPVSLTVFTEIPYAGSSDVDSTQNSISGLSIRIRDAKGKVFQLIDMGNGTYESASTEIIGEAGSVYTMEFTHKNRMVKASTTIPTKPLGFMLSKTSVGDTDKN